jgi:hypothetical protein
MMLRGAVTEARGVKQFLQPLQQVARVLGKDIWQPNLAVPLEESDVER